MYITLEGLKIHAFHGVDPQERIVGADFIIDLKIKTDFTNAAINDSLENTISYAEIFELVKREMNIPSQLLEHACNRICKVLIEEFKLIEEVHIKMFKENPPMNSDSKRIGVEMICRK